MLNFLRHIFLPHESNGHRPKMLHHQSLAAFILIILSLLYVVPPIQNEYPAVLGVSYSITVEDLVRLTNEKRKAAGLQSLTLNQKLSNAAGSKVSYMFEKNFWAHIAPDGTTPWYFIKNTGYEYQYAGENLARGFNTAEEVTEAWMNSPTHRENLLSPNYTDIGFGVGQGSLTGSDTILVAQYFGSKYTKTEELAAVIEPSGVPPASIVTEEIKEETSVPEIESQSAVAASVNKPLIDSKSSTFNLSIFIFGLFIIILTLDAIFIERKRISRVFAHNFDHIIFLVIMSLAVIIMGRGVIL